MPQRPISDEETDLLSTRKAAQLIGMSVRTLYRYEEQGRIESISTPGGHRRWRRADLEALLQPRSVA